MKEKPQPEEHHMLQGDPARDMSTLHHMCVTNFKELQAMSRTQVRIVSHPHH